MSTTPAPLRRRPPAADPAARLAAAEPWTRAAEAPPTPAAALPRPWDNIPVEAQRPYTIHLPARLHAKLLLIGRLAIDGSTRKFVIDTLEAAADKELAKYGL